MELRLEHLVKDFSGVKAVDDLSLSIQDGKLTGLLGPSGCGKSTLLYMISGLEKPTSGKLFFGDEDVTELPVEARGIGLVFQNYALYPHMTVEQNIMFPLENGGMKKDEARERAFQMAKLVQIDEYVRRKPSQLSGGQQQRVAIARAMVKEPRVLLLDEPLSNLDARLRLEMREEIRRIQQETGVTTIFVTHDQEEAMSITDQVVLMKKGVIQQVGNPQHMYLEPVNRFVASFLGNPPMNFFPMQADHGRIRLEEGYELTFSSKIHGEVMAGIRPESWMPGKGIRVMVEAVEMRGRDQLVTFLYQNARVQAIIDNYIRVSPRSVLELEIKNKMVYLFDKETGLRLNQGEFAYE